MPGSCLATCSRRLRAGRRASGRGTPSALPSPRTATTPPTSTAAAAVAMRAAAAAADAGGRGWPSQGSLRGTPREAWSPALAEWVSARRSVVIEDRLRI